MHTSTSINTGNCDWQQAAMKRMISGKTMSGLDDMPVDAWRCLEERTVDSLIRVFNTILETEKMYLRSVR